MYPSHFLLGPILFCFRLFYDLVTNNRCSLFRPRHLIDFQCQNTEIDDMYSLLKNWRSRICCFVWSLRIYCYMMKKVK